jgi:hypothetical protein
MPPASENIFDKANSLSAEAAPGPEMAKPPGLPKSMVPPDLVDRCVAGECVLLAGSGLSARSGLWTWGESIAHLLE